MKVLLVYPNIVESPKDISIGLAYLSATLKQNNHKVGLIDSSFGITDKEIVQKTKEFNPDLVAITTATNDFEYAKHISKLIKKTKNIPIIAGGYHPTLSPEEAIKYFDMVCIGDGEQPILELANNLKKTNIKNVWFRKNNKIIKNPIGPLVQDRDLLPFPDREIYNYKKYLKWNHNTATFFTSKGCPFQCTYCINHTLQKLYKNKGKYMRFRSVDSLLKEIKQVVNKYHPTSIEFYDDTFTLDKERINEFCKKYPKEINLPFTINGRVNTVDREMLFNLKKAGLTRISIGVESGDPYIRNKILKRNMTDKEIIETFNWAKEAGIKTYSFNMIGIPFETKSSIKKTIRLNQKIKPDFVGVSIFNAFKGTELYNVCEKNNWLIKGKASKSYFQDTNVRHPNFTINQLRRIRNSFGFKVFIKYNPLRAFIDLFDRNFSNLPYYTFFRSKIIKILRLREK